MLDSFQHPGLILIIGGLLVGVLRAQARTGAVLAIPLLALWALWSLPSGTVWQTPWLDYTLTPVTLDRLSRLFATIFGLMAFGGGLYALRQTSRLEIPAAYVYAGSAIGVTLAGDLITLFIFWELMTVGSALVIWSNGTRESYAAGMRYVMIHLFGGMLLFAGIVTHVMNTGDVAFARMSADSLGTLLILAGFLVNAGAPPLSAWLPDAYPAGSWSGTVFLSAFTTKTAVYVLMRGFPGTELLIWVGLFMVFYGIVYALLENDMRRILAYSIVNQVGFMVAGIGIGTDLALNGAAAHAFTHIIYKALLLMSAGAVLLATGRRKCSELGGLFHSMPLTTICGTIGALAISSFPLTSGFISKSMVSQAAADAHLLTVWLALAAASAGVFLHAGIKFPWFVFFQKDSGLRPPDPPASMRWAMVFFAFLCIALGVWPDPLYAMLPYAVDYVPYTAAHVLTQLQLLLFSGLAFFVMLSWLKRTPTITLDIDWLWRVALPSLVRVAVGIGVRTKQAMLNVVLGISRWAIAALRERGALDGSYPRLASTSGMATWMMVMLLAYLILYYAL